MTMNERGGQGIVHDAAALFPEGWRTAYLVILGLLLAAGLGLAVLEEFVWNGRIGTVVKLLVVVRHGGGIAPVSALLAVFLTEAWRSMALLSEKLRDRIRNQGRALGREEGLVEGRVEGRLEAASKWQAWFQRYEEARRKGEPFNEPPPDVG